MDNQHRKFDLMNTLKDAEKGLLTTLDACSKVEGVNPRSIAIAKTHAQTAFMWAIRAIMQPNGE